MADARRLVELSMVPELAKEVATQIDAAAGGGAVDWADVTGKPAVIAAGADAAAARTAIGAGTSNLAIGTTASTAMAGDTPLLAIGSTATTAKAGDYTPPAASTTVAGVIMIGTTATTAKAGNAVQTATQTTATAIAPGTATNVQAILAELAARITALESA